MKNTKYIALLLAFALLVFGGCSQQLMSGELSEVYDRLELVDDFYEQSVPKLREDPISSQDAGTFRNVPFGTPRSEVETSEALTVQKQYDNAIDYVNTNIYGFNMVPTYWFNSSDQLYRGTYYLKSSLALDRLISSITVRLSDQFGQPVDNNFYTYENEIARSSSQQSFVDMINQNMIYFYAYYTYGETDIELIIENGNSSSDSPSYDVYIMFTDYIYYEE